MSLHGKVSTWIGAGMLCLALASAASAQVLVTVDGDTAHADISLTGANGQTYTAEVIIQFDTPQNLTPEALNLTAEIIDPALIDLTRMPPGDSCLIYPVICSCPDTHIGNTCPPPTIDPDFPIMVTVEPITLPWLFYSGFDGGDAGNGELSFKNTYHFEMHTHDLEYSDDTLYRLFKAPIGDIFQDVTTEVAMGSFRARGRGGAFSQFVIASDPRNQLDLARAKLGDLSTRILTAALADGLRLDLLGLVAKVEALLVVDLLGALTVLDELIGTIELDAGISIPNIWDASHTVPNDAGEMDSLAQSARFSMTRPTTKH
jgi:hypothetical protein